MVSHSCMEGGGIRWKEVAMTHTTQEFLTESTEKLMVVNGETLSPIIQGLFIGSIRVP